MGVLVTQELPLLYSLFVFSCRHNGRPLVWQFVKWFFITSFHISLEKNIVDGMKGLQ